MFAGDYPQLAAFKKTCVADPQARPDAKPREVRKDAWFHATAILT
jgi:hypothetical protein